MCYLTYDEAKEALLAGADELETASEYWRGIEKQIEKIYNELHQRRPLLCVKYDENCDACPFGRVNRRCLKTRSPRNWMKRTLLKAMGVAEEMATAFDSIQNTH